MKEKFSAHESIPFQTPCFEYHLDYVKSFKTVAMKKGQILFFYSCSFSHFISIRAVSNRISLVRIVNVLHSLLIIRIKHENVEDVKAQGKSPWTFSQVRTNFCFNTSVIKVK